jgi:hypothetical protein
MSELIKKFETNFDLYKMLDCLETVISKTSWHSKENQIAIQVRKGSTDWHDGLGKAAVQTEKGWEDAVNEQDFTQIHPALKGSYFEEVLNNLPFKPVRARLMRLIPKRCYSTHYDFTGRYHLALVTSYHAHFVFVKDQKVVHIPADGCAYYVDTTKMHTALNGDTEDRIHLVIGEANGND